MRSFDNFTFIVLGLLIICILFRANDVGYIATVQMGTPPRDFRLLMDSGSADLWVGAEGCQSQAGGDCVRLQLRDAIHPALRIWSKNRFTNNELTIG